jgi:hypothetical protein
LLLPQLLPQPCAAPDLLLLPLLLPLPLLLLPQPPHSLLLRHH